MPQLITHKLSPAIASTKYSTSHAAPYKCSIIAWSPHSPTAFAVVEICCNYDLRVVDLGFYGCFFEVAWLDVAGLDSTSLHLNIQVLLGVWQLYS